VLRSIHRRVLVLPSREASNPVAYSGVQAHLHAKLMKQFVHHGATSFLTSIPNDFAGSDLPRLDWRTPQEQIDESLITEPVHVARSYIGERLLIETDKSVAAQS
jgi:hypothetical protein